LKKHGVVRAHASETRIFRGADRKAFEAIRGKARRVRRHGKVLLLEFTDTAVLSHLGMTGKWVLRETAEEKSSRAFFELSDHSFVHYKDPRMFGRLEPMAPEAFAEVEATLGPDPLQEKIDGRALREAIGKTKLPIKVALMDQARLAGVGNIQASEALWRAKIHPSRTVPALAAKEWSALAKAIRASIDFTLKQQGRAEIVYVEEPRAPNPFLVYGRAGEPCKRCKTRIATDAQAGRTTYFCPRCQKR
jgi:formamidopyrimidine-DNA glycosylase